MKSTIEPTVCSDCNGWGCKLVDKGSCYDGIISRATQSLKDVVIETGDICISEMHKDVLLVVSPGPQDTARVYVFCYSSLRQKLSLWALDQLTKLL